MNRVARLIPILALALFFAVIFNSHAHSTPSSTIVCSSINTNTTWTAAQSPYEICNTAGIAVQTGITLTIEPGVTVIFDGSAYQFTVQGTLNALGTADQPITMTATSATPGSWRGIAVDYTGGPKAVLNMDYATMLYGGFSGSFGAEIYADKASINLTHSHIRNSAGNGLYATGSTVFSVQSTSFENNGQNAIQLAQPATDLAMTGLTATGNGTNAVHVTGLSTHMAGQRRWTDPGIPYLIEGSVNNSVGDVLTIDPGVTMDFSNTGIVSIAGELLAQGTETQTITMTSLTKTPGDWIGIYADGGTHQAIVQLDYVTVEYGGRDINGANIEAANGKIIVHHSIIRNSSKDGVKLDPNAIGTVIQSQVYGNAHYGAWTINPNNAILASNNWWGAASGPHPDNAACGAGIGDKVTAGVLFQPFANAPNAIQAFPLTNAPNITLTPDRWYAPADGGTKITFDITVRDGDGNPIPGRTVTLNHTLGTAVDMGNTGADGKTRAFLSSNVAGNATVTASLVPATACEGAVSPESDVTFTPPVNITDLLPNAPASYFDGDISVTPQPVIVNVPTTILAKLTNPLTTSVTVDVEFGYAQSGIALAFGKIKSIPSLVIPGSSSVPVSATFSPPFSGHYCVQVAYTITQVGAMSPQAAQAARQLKQFNMNVQQPTTSSPDKNAELTKTRNSLKQVNRFVGKAYDNSIAVPLFVANKGIEWDLNNAEKISNALQGDPPRQDYTLVTLPQVLQLPPIQAIGISQGRADALNALDSALAQANAYGTAAEIAFDRAGGAAAAGDLSWESTQTGIMLEYNYDYGVALITASQKIDDLLQQAAGEGVTSVIITPADVAALQAQLAVPPGFTPDEINDAHAIGLTDADLEAIRLDTLAAKPEDLPGDVVTRMKDISASLNLLGRVLTNPAAFNPGVTVTGGLALGPQAAPANTMVQVYDTVTTLQVANPISTTATIDLTARRIDLPADWSVQVSPAQVTLPASGQVTVTVSIIAGAPLPQGSRPRVAVEGSINSQLIGGVVIDVMAPVYRPFDGKLRAYLPRISR